MPLQFLSLTNSFLSNLLRSFSYKAVVLSFGFLYINSAMADEFPYAFMLDDSDKPAIVNIWATWCAPCVKEMPELETLAAEGEYNVYAISVDAKEKAVNRFWQQNKFQHLKLKHDASGEIFYSAFAGKPIPTTFIISSNGEVKGVEQGERLWAHPDMKQKILQILEK